MEKLHKIGRHTLDGRFGNCISCGAIWEAAEDNECRTNQTVERLVSFVRRAAMRDRKA